MSMPNLPENNIQREEAVNLILASVAMEELGLSHILNAEGEKLQYILGTTEGTTGLAEPPTVKDILDINKSVRQTLKDATRLQMTLGTKTENVMSIPTTQGPQGPFLSCYLEASGNQQTVGTEEYITFDTNPDNDAIDIVGNGISVNAEGTVFTINRTGLYHVEWSIDLSGFTPPAIIGIAENGEVISAITAFSDGNVSSGALINVRTTPYLISLVNFAGEIRLQNPAPTIDASASIRILRFADGPVL